MTHSPNPSTAIDALALRRNQALPPRRRSMPEMGLDAMQDASASASGTVASLGAMANPALATMGQAPPTLEILREDRGIFEKFWGWDRLLPYDFVFFQSEELWSLYDKYLDEFYTRHKPPTTASAADALHKCLDATSYLLHSNPGCRFDSDADVCKDIHHHLSQLMDKEGQLEEYPFLADASACIEKETELLIELQKLGPGAPYEEYYVSREIREGALQLALFRGDWRLDVAAVLLGIKNEAQWLRENIMHGHLDFLDTTVLIRSCGAAFLSLRVEEFESGSNMSEGSDQMSDEVDGNAVAATEEVNQP